MVEAIAETTVPLRPNEELLSEIPITGLTQAEKRERARLEAEKQAQLEEAKRAKEEEEERKVWPFIKLHCLGFQA